MPTETPERPFTSIGQIIRVWRDRAPDDVALITDERTWRVVDLDDLVRAQVDALRRLDAVGGRVALHAQNSAASLAAIFAASTAGAILIPLNTRLAAGELLDQLDRTKADVLLGDEIPGFTGRRIPLDALASPGVIEVSAPPGGAPDRTATRHVDSSDLAWIIFTSGSTGRPKGVLVTQTSLAAAVAVTARARPLADDDVYLYPFPLFHVAAYNVLHAYARRRPVVLPSRFDARRIIELCHEHDVTAMSLTATMLRMILDALHADQGLQPPSSLRTIAYGAAPMPTSLLREAHDLLGCAFAQGYGSTELSGNAIFLGPEEHRQGLGGERRFLGAAGYGGPGIGLRVVDDVGNALPAGEAGEILVSGEQICAGYLDDPAATASAIRDGWLHTGDIGTLDDDGLLTIVDRAKDIVVTGGENVSSREVEDALRDHAFVADVAVVGVPDERWGEAVTAVVVPRRDTSTTVSTAGETGRPVAADEAFHRQLADHVATVLAGYKKPRRVYVIDALPTNANGKVDKPTLRSRLGRITPDTALDQN